MLWAQPSHQDTEIQENTDPEVKLYQASSHPLAQVAVCCGKWSQKVLIDPGDRVLFHNIDMKSEASGIPISHNKKQAAKPSHEVLSPNRNNPRPFILIHPVPLPTCRQSGNIVQWPVVAHGNCTVMYRSE